MVRANYLIDKDIFAYMQEFSIAETPSVAAIRSKTEEMRGWGKILTSDCGHMLHFLLRLTGTKRCLDIGTFTGLSAILMAEALPVDGEVHTCEVKPAYIEIAQENFSNSSVSKKITLHEGDAVATLRQLLEERGDGFFDFAFIDADKKNNLQYFKLAISLVKEGGLIAVDNVFWYKQILDPGLTDSDTQSVREFNQYCKSLPADQRVMVPLGDGLTLIRVSSDLKTV